MSAKLILTRKKEITNRRQAFKVIVDGKEAGEIHSDKTEEFELTPGVHELKFKVSWMGSEAHTVTLYEGKNTYLMVRSGMKYYTPLYFLLIAGLLFPVILRFANIPSSLQVDMIRMVLVFPAILYWLYYVTINRKKYVIIEEDKSSPFAS